MTPGPEARQSSSANAFARAHAPRRKRSRPECSRLATAGARSRPPQSSPRRSGTCHDLGHELALDETFADLHVVRPRPARHGFGPPGRRLARPLAVRCRRADRGVSAPSGPRSPRPDACGSSCQRLPRTCRPRRGRRGTVLVRRTAPQRRGAATASTTADLARDPTVGCWLYVDHLVRGVGTGSCGPDTLPAVPYRSGPLLVELVAHRPSDAPLSTHAPLRVSPRPFQPRPHHNSAGSTPRTTRLLHRCARPGSRCRRSQRRQRARVRPVRT